LTKAKKVDLEAVKAGVEGLSSIYEDRKEKVLNPDAIGKSLLERLPTPTGWRILILPYRGKGKTEGGVILPDQAVEEQLFPHRSAMS